MRIRDAGIRRFTENLQRSGTAKLDGGNVMQLLAEVGDTFTKNSGQLLREMTRPGVTRREQFELARTGLDRHELADLQTVLDQSGFQMESGAKNFLEALT